MAITVAIIEDDAGIREHFAALIDDTPGFRVAGLYESAEQALKELAPNPPNVALIDINLPRMNGVECVRRLKQIAPQVNVIIFTVYEDSDKVFAALEAGACGYLLKRTPPEEVLQALRDVNSGGAPMSSFIARKVVQSFYRQSSTSPELAKLSAREEEILSLVAKGFGNKDIARNLNISNETVRAHLRNIYEKLHVNSRSQAVVKFMNQG